MNINNLIIKEIRRSINKNLFLDQKEVFCINSEIGNYLEYFKNTIFAYYFDSLRIIILCANMNALSIIVPVYNEENTINVILDKIKNVRLLNEMNKDIVIINDGSTDNSDNLINKYIEDNKFLSIHYLTHKVNEGKGASIQSALKSISGNYVIIQDADLEYDPEEYNILLRPMIDGFADVVYGSRFISGNPHRILFFGNRMGNVILTLLSNIFTNLNLSDIQSCYKLFKTDIIKTLTLKENGFGFEAEVTARISKIPKIKIYEVGISYHGRTYEEGKKLKFRDALRIFYCVIKYNIFAK